MARTSESRAAEPVKTELRPAPWWALTARALIRRLGAGRYRAMNLLPRSSSPFAASLSSELGGYSYRCDLRDLLGRQIFYMGRYEAQETALVQALLRPGMSFVDVGANWGYFTLLAAHRVGRDGRVISLEPHPILFSFLQDNVARNGLNQVSALDIAASHDRGRLRLADFDPAGGNFGLAHVSLHGSKAGSVEVAARPLDDVLQDGDIGVDLLKMDIEGWEWAALRGLGRSLGRRRVKRLIVELHPARLAQQGLSVEEVLAPLYDSGYQGWRIDHSPATTRRFFYSDGSSPASLLRPFELSDKAASADWRLFWAAPGLDSLGHLER